MPRTYAMLIESRKAERRGREGSGDRRRGRRPKTRRAVSGIPPAASGVGSGSSRHAEAWRTNRTFWRSTSAAAASSSAGSRAAAHARATSRRRAADRRGAAARVPPRSFASSIAIARPRIGRPRSTPGSTSCRRRARSVCVVASVHRRRRREAADAVAAAYVGAAASASAPPICRWTVRVADAGAGRHRSAARRRRRQSTAASRNAPAIAVDMGTATTVDLIGADGAFEGGAISPGRRSALAALHAGTASLPQLEASVLGDAAGGGRQIDDRGDGGGRLLGRDRRRARVGAATRRSVPGRAASLSHRRRRRGLRSADWAEGEQAGPLCAAPGARRHSPGGRRTSPHHERARSRTAEPAC